MSCDTSDCETTETESVISNKIGKINSVSIDSKQVLCLKF